MSRATELAVKCGAKSDIRLTWYDKVSETKQEVTNLFGIFMTSQQIEAFYHAARAEALRETLKVCADEYTAADCWLEINDMIAREGK